MGDNQRSRGVVIARNSSLRALDHQRRDLHSIKLSYLMEDRATSSIKVGTWNLKCQASCALDHFFLLSHVLNNHNDLYRLIWMGPNRLPQFDYLYALFTTELFG
jgi:hypothetical protein